MAYFAMQHQMLFHDTMAYGSHHHSVNVKLQNLARETLLFESKVDGRLAWEEELEDIYVLTREAYSLNLTPVGLAEKVAVLMSYEDPSRSTMRLCFRVVNAGGEAVSCGYQTMIMVHKKTNELVPAPRLLTQYLDPSRGYSLLEPLIDPSFADRAHTGSLGVKAIFPQPVRELGARIAGESLAEARPRIVDEQFNEFEV